MTEDITSRIWDVIVIGTGMGGGTVGRRLAEKSLSVLFVEKGAAGKRAEAQGIDAAIADPFARSLHGYWPMPVTAQLNGKPTEFFAPLGAGVGGSSVFYAAALERPEPHDLDDSPERPHPTGGWPVSHAQFRPYFAEAERMFEVSGTPDPLSPDAPGPLKPPPPIPPGDAALLERLRGAGLNPYRGHLALRNLPGCANCLGRKCPRDCKMDGRSAGVEPALATGRAALLDHAEVRALRGSRNRISHVEVRRGGETLALKARAYVLAAGALASPLLLMASKSEHWPDGCANDSGLVGRNLMFHLTEMFALWPGRRDPGAGAAKGIALRDHYYRDGTRFGMVQAMGISASYGEILHFLNLQFDRSPLAGIRPLRHLMRLPAGIAANLFGSAALFAGILEDLPYRTNRVLPGPGDPLALNFTYDFAPELLARRRRFRAAINRSLRGQARLFLNRAPEPNFGHASGTLSFGNDPATSVLNPECRAHSIRNLHVADASFMPTSTGVNPSLLIAANALRVADHLAETLQEGGLP
ncbi:MAG: GMC family oxidoreductase [Rhodobacteraceae bacterium]|nr:GMC family oxidoreductase [Paracoccaceae bacterium]